MNNIIAAQLFINRLKPLLASKKVVFDPRNSKTQLFLMQEGMNTDDVFAYLERLAPSNYFDGPKEDYNGTSGDVMMFLYPYKKTRIYIKLKIWKNNDEDFGVVMSFHEEGEYD